MKQSFSAEVPFNRMLVKIKREIIAFEVPGVDPNQYTSRRLSPQQLKAWLDEGRRICLLDTRNEFEVSVGTFKNAVALPVDDFRSFPAAAASLPEDFKDQTVVTFCTGGIRCEKAAPYLETEGFKHVYQLDGGILKYFAECGDAHFEGQCFVFDKRVALDPDLSVGGLKQCFCCQAILSVEDQLSDRYVVGESCPQCYASPAECQLELIHERNQSLQKFVTPLPGSEPYDNIRPVSVPGRFDHSELLEFLEGMHTHLSRADWEAVCHDGALTCRGEPVFPGRIVRAGERLLHHIPAVQEPAVNADIQVLHEDEALVAVHKPAPLPMHPCGRFNRNSLDYILNQVYHPSRLRVVHRLDADTAGIVLLSKTRQIARQMHQQFDSGQIRKLYIVRALGVPREPEFECCIPLSDRPGKHGVRLPDRSGVPAVTRFRLIGEHEDGSSFLEAWPETGRTNQIRAHLWQLGMPIAGDPIYQVKGSLGRAKSLHVGDPPLCLHSLAIAFEHPLTRLRSVHRAMLPTWLTTEYSSTL